MKTIKKDELFQSLGDFLKLKGVELKDGSYAQRIRQGCNLLTDAINCTQRTVRQAKVEVDKKLDQLRQTVHEVTAPKPSANSATAKRASARTSKATKGRAGGKKMSAAQEKRRAS